MNWKEITIDQNSLWSWQRSWLPLEIILDWQAEFEATKTERRSDTVIQLQWLRAQPIHRPPNLNYHSRQSDSLIIRFIQPFDTIWPEPSNFLRFIHCKIGILPNVRQPRCPSTKLPLILIPFKCVPENGRLGYVQNQWINSNLGDPPLT